MWGNTTPSTELLRDFCAGIGPLQLGIVLVWVFLNRSYGHFFPVQLLLIFCCQMTGHFFFLLLKRKIILVVMSQLHEMNTFCKQKNNPTTIIFSHILKRKINLFWNPLSSNRYIVTIAFHYPFFLKGELSISF